MVSFCYIVLLLGPAIAAAAYLNGFAFARLCGTKTHRRADDHQTRFAILIPAHNEQQVIDATLDSIEALHYSPEKRSVYIIADNCTDNTVELVRRRELQCLERNDSLNVGKGFALTWGLEQIRNEPYDAVLIVDADCPVDPDLLEVLDGYFQGGAEAVQSNHRVTNVDASPIAYVAGVGRVLEYDFLYAPKSALGFPVMLVGTGMAIGRKLLERIPWESQSCTEDTEYTIRLARRGVRVEFAADAYVQCSGVTSNHELEVQRSRWAAGNLALGRANGLRLIFSGLLRRRPLLIDIGFSLLIASRPLLLAHAALTIAIGIDLQWIWPSGLNLWLVRLALFLIPAYTIWVGIGILSIGVTPNRILHLIRTPSVVLRLGWISLRALLPGPNMTWRRTPRT